MNEEYYIKEGGEKTGPFTYNELTARGIDIDTPVLTPLSDEWQNASYIPEFIAYFGSIGYYFPTEGNLAGFGWRALAFGIDYILTCIVVSIIGIQTGWLKIPATTTFDPAAAYNMFSPKARMIMELNMVGVFLLYNTLFEAISFGSIGKKMCRLKVVDADGRKLSFVIVIMRNMGALLSLFLWGLPFLSVFFTERKQAWYDRLTNAYTVKTE